MGSTDAKQPPPLLTRELMLRVVSGLVLAALSLGLTWWGVRPFAVLVLAVSIALSWEWGRIVRGQGFDAPLSVHLGAVGAAVVLAGTGTPALGAVAVLIGAILVLLLRFGGGFAVHSAAGVLYVGWAAVALLWFRGDPTYGLAAVLLLFATVWTTDTAAYFVGRIVGGPKLWPRISPNKTWAGLIGGVLASAAVAGVAAGFIPGASLPRLVVLGALVAGVAQLGDLAESALKRSFGVKDASQLIPGHGGFMDRVDGLIFALAAAAVYALAVNPHAPAAALLFGQ